MSTINTKPMAAFRACWKAGVPLISIDSADPAATVRNCITSLNGKGNQIPLLTWDRVAGLRGTNIPGQPAELGNNAAMAIAEGTPGPDMLTNPVELLAMVARKAPEESILFLHGMHAADMLQAPPVSQAIWNCRDTCKPKHITLVCLGPSIKLPAELSQDVMSLSEELPNSDELGAILDSTFKDAELNPDLLTAEQREKAIDVMRGLDAFAAEQVLATSLTKQGIDFDSLWSRKVRMIEQTPGLSVWRGQESFDDLGGLSNLKEFLTRILTSGKTRVNAIGFGDEIEKALAGTAGDTSGTSQDQLQALLKLLQDYNIPAMILIGHGGTGKSAISKAAGSIANSPVISFDFGAMKGSLVGESEARVRLAVQQFIAVSQGKGIFIFTCNKIGVLPPEFRRRCTLGTFFVDLPTAQEQVKIWQIWMKRYAIDAQPLPDCIDWTGAEIRGCCDVAFRTGLTLVEASKYVVPVIKSAPDQVEALRTLAHNRFISASKPGPYVYNKQSTPQATGRKVSL